MSTKKTLGLVMIVKNEERCLEKCLKAVRNLVDEIYITDTGSTDKTVEIIGIAVDTKKRHSGIGTKLIDYVKDKSSKPIIAETDSDAVMFYKTYGFDIEEKIVSKSNISYSRYVCTLNYK